jgi:CheY-like chemotaxis protein
MKIRALVIDDQPTWLEIFKELLSELGCDVVTTDNYSDAIDIIEKKYLHLVVTDIRLRDDDKDNQQGLEILSYINKIGFGDIVGKVVITGYGTRDWARQAFKEYKVHDFIPKQGPDGKGFDENDFQQSLQAALREQIGINFDLLINYSQGLTLAAIATKIGHGIVENCDFETLCWEADDLLRKLFFDAKRIIISPPLASESKFGIVLVTPFTSSGQGKTLAVKLGFIADLEDDLELEFHNFQEKKIYLSEQKYKSIERINRTRMLGGIVYSLEYWFHN